MGTVQERVQLIVETISKGLKPLSQNLKVFGGVMTQNLESFKKQTQANTSMINTGGKLAQRVRLMTHGMRGFRMEMLGVMFFGMAMTRFFRGLLQPALQLAGVFEIMSAALGLLFLPVALEIQELAVWFLGKVGDIGERTKLFIGVLAILGVILGTILFLVGQTALGIGSLILAFEKTAIFAGVSKVIALIAASFSSFLLILGIVAIAVAGFVIAWKENFLGMREIVAFTIKGIKQTFKGLVQIVTSTFKLLLSIIEGDSDKIIANLKGLGVGIKDVLVGLLKTVSGLLVTIALSIFRGIKGIIDSMVKLIVAGINIILERISELLRVVGLLPGGLTLRAFTGGPLPANIPIIAPVPITQPTTVTSESIINISVNAPNEFDVVTREE